MDDFDKIVRGVTEAEFERIAKGLLDEALKHSHWDGPTRIYLVLGSPDRPHYAKFVEGQMHPVDLMRTIYKDGIRIPANAIGMAVLTEAYRHMHWSEAPKELTETILTVTATVYTEESEEERARIAEETYNKAARRFMPSQLPPEARREIRMVNVMFRDGTTGVGQHTRDGDGALDDFVSGMSSPSDDEGQQLLGRVPDAMTDMLNDTYPLAGEEQE